MSSSATANPIPRDAKGQFAAGNHGGPGNPYARQTAALRQALLDSVTAADVAAIARALIEKASQGNVQAAKLLLSYTLGKPAPAADPDRLDVNEWSNFQETSHLMQELPHMIKAPDASLPIDLVRLTRPGMAREIGRTFGAMLKDPPLQPAYPDLEMVDETPSPNGVFDEAAWLSILGERAGKAKAPSPNGKSPRNNAKNGQTAPRRP